MIGAMILQFQFYGVQMLGRLQDVRGHDLDGIRIPRFCPGLQRSFVFLLEFPFLNANRSKRAHTYWMRAAIIGFGTCIVRILIGIALDSSMPPSAKPLAVTRVSSACRRNRGLIPIRCANRLY